MNAHDVKDALMQAEADVKEVVREIIEEWTEPILRNQVQLFWTMMAPEDKENFKKDKPEAYNQIVRFLE